MELTLESASIFDLLRGIEKKSIACVSAVDDQSSLMEVWSGLAFKVAGARVLAPMTEVNEILNLPAALTRVPGAKVWVKGIANIRGNLLPIIDFQAFLGGKSVVTNQRSRVLVIKLSGITTGLLVGDVQGIRRFDDDQKIASARIEGVVGRFVNAAFENDDGIWPVLSMKRLVNDDFFKMAAI